MKKKNLLLVILAIALVFGMTAVGCNNDSTDDEENNYTFEYKIGDTGPGGGKIFYRSGKGFTMTDNNNVCHYLEAAPNNMSAELKWASSSVPNSTNIAGTGTAIGTGRKNTALILATDAAAPAAKACKEYSGGGKNDWFLPSKDELNELHKNRTSVGNTTTANSYWSSSQASNNTAWVHSFLGSGTQATNNKEDAINVRAIRAF